jgi:hypothetical protein
MNIFKTICNFFYRTKVVDHETVKPTLVVPEKPVLTIKAPKQRTMSWKEANLLIRGEKMDSSVIN